MTKPRVKPLEWQQSQHGIELEYAWCPLLEKNFYAETTSKKPKVEAMRQRMCDDRLAAALDLTPDPAVQALVERQRELARWVAAESWRISGLVSNNDEAMRVHVEIGKMFGSLQSAEKPAVLALVEALRASARQHRVIAGMDLIGASAVAFNAALDAEAALAAFDKTTPETKGD